MTDDRLVADLDYSDAPCPDRDDICSITVTLLIDVEVSEIVYIRQGREKKEFL
jgi:hypothetical protein